MTLLAVIRAIRTFLMRALGKDAPEEATRRQDLSAIFMQAAANRRSDA